MDVGTCGPAEPKQGGRGQEGAKDRDAHTFLGFDLAVFIVHLLLDKIEVGEVNGEGNKYPA